VHTHANMSQQFYAVVVSKTITIFINHMYVYMYKRQVTPSKLRQISSATVGIFHHVTAA